MTNPIYVELPSCVGAAVILNGVMIYHDDCELGYSNASFSAKEVAIKLGKAIKERPVLIELTWAEISKNDWTFDDVLEETMRHAMRLDRLESPKNYL